MTASPVGYPPARNRTIVTVTTPASTYDLVTADIVRDDLQLTTADISDAALARMITRQSLNAAQYCNRTLPAETVSEQIWLQRENYPYQTIGGQEPLQLSRWPIVAGSLPVVTENATVLVKDTDYAVDYVRGQLLRLDANSYPCLWPTFPLVVAYVGGLSPIPPDLQDAIVTMIKGRYFSRTRDPKIKAEDVTGVLRTDYWVGAIGEDGDVPPEAAAILDNYRVPLVC